MTFLLSCPVLVILFSRTRAQVASPGRILTVYGLNDASSLKDVSFGGFNDDPQFWGFNPPPPKKTKPQKGAWLGTFQPNWQNHKIAISPTAKIESTPNFDRVIEPHS